MEAARQEAALAEQAAWLGRLDRHAGFCLGFSGACVEAASQEECQLAVGGQGVSRTKVLELEVGTQQAAKQWRQPA